MKSVPRPAGLVHKDNSEHVVLHLILEMEQDVTQKHRILLATLKRWVYMRLLCDGPK